MMKLTLAFLACAALLAIETAAQQSVKKPSDEEVKELKGKCKATIHQTQSHRPQSRFIFNNSVGRSESAGAGDVDDGVSHGCT